MVKFIGRPKDLSPRATFYSSLWLRDVSFDRHDWFVSREDGSDLRRCVIDFYNGKEEKQSQSQQQSMVVVGVVYLMKIANLKWRLWNWN